MNTEKYNRKLTAIFSADVEGYSRLMRDDEDATIHTIKAYRRAISKLVSKYRGRVVDSPGDNILAEFGSVLDAVIGKGRIAAWDDDAGIQWGSKNNKYYNNTVHMPSDGRWAINLKNGSTGCKVYNNILIHENGARGGLEIDTSSLAGFFSDYNVLTRVSVNETTMNLSAWQASYARDVRSFSQTAGQTFVSPGSDYHLLATGLVVNGGIELPEITDDLDGNARPQGAGYDIGAYEKTVACPACTGTTPRVENVTFPAGCNCTCTGFLSITIGTNVTVESGATVTFEAPVVTIEPGFHAESGSNVTLRQELGWTAKGRLAGTRSREGPKKKDPDRRRIAADEHPE